MISFNIIYFTVAAAQGLIFSDSFLSYSGLNQSTHPTPPYRYPCSPSHPRPHPPGTPVALCDPRRPWTHLEGLFLVLQWSQPITPPSRDPTLQGPCDPSSPGTHLKGLFLVSTNHPTPPQTPPFRDPLWPTVIPAAHGLTSRDCFLSSSGCFLSPWPKDADRRCFFFFFSVFNCFVSSGQLSCV